jgi:outer membrane immunogenic protein
LYCANKGKKYNGKIMNKSISIILASAVALSATPVLAEVTTGPRAEVLVGYDSASVDLGEFGLGSYSEGGVAYGVGLGYDFAATPTAAIGLDVEYADSSTNIEYRDGSVFAKVSTGRDLYVGARATFAVSEAFNLYAKAGYTNARLKAFVTDGVDSFSESANGDGIRAGVGGQLNFGKVYALAEYRYSNYEANLSRNQALVGLGIRF